MRRLFAVLLVCAVLLGSFALADGTNVFSYDFDIQFHLDASQFPFRQREHMQGYADLLEMLEFKGNISWCEETQSTDLYLTVVPLTNPDSEISVHIWGIPTMHRVTSPLLADKAACFNPGAFLHFAVSAREVFQVPMPYLALLNPQTTLSAFRTLSDSWKEYAGEMTSSGSISYAAVKEIAGAWQAQLEENTKLNDWIKALVESAYGDGLAAQDLNTLPEQLLNVADGKPLTVMRRRGTLRIGNEAGDVIWEQTEEGNMASYALNIPESMARYVPSFSADRDVKDGLLSFALDAEWECAEGTAQTDPETGLAKKRIDLHLEAEGLPASLPADTAFSGMIAQTGTILPQFAFRMSGSTKEDGRVHFALAFADGDGKDEVFFCEGTITPAVYETPMEYSWEELATEYNILNLSYAAQGEMIDAIKRPLVLGMIDFLYELPASACQSIMDDLEDSGILRTMLQ